MSFSFIQISDHHLMENESEFQHGFSPAYSLRAVLRHIANNPAARADFLVTTGDLVNVTSDSAYQNFAGLTGIKGNAPVPGPLLVTAEGLQEFPTYILPGNHDDRLLLSQTIFPGAAMHNRYNARFDHGGVQFICLDWGDRALAAIEETTLDFLRACLDRSLPSIILMHHHLSPIGSRWLDRFIPPDADRFWNIVTAPQTNHQILGIICGHVHMTSETQVAGIPVLTIRSTCYQFAHQDDPLICLQPPHYRYLTVSDQVLTSRIFEVLI